MTAREAANQPVPAGGGERGAEAKSAARGEPTLVAPAAHPLNPRVVALGGGHGLFASLSALRRVTRQLTAIVTVADDGGSSGVLRRDFGVLPPGDATIPVIPVPGHGGRP